MSLATLPHSFQPNFPSLNHFPLAKLEGKSVARIEELAFLVLCPQNILANNLLSIEQKRTGSTDYIHIPNAHGSLDKGIVVSCFLLFEFLELLPFLLLNVSLLFLFLDIGLSLFLLLVRRQFLLFLPQFFESFFLLEALNVFFVVLVFVFVFAVFVVAG